MFPVIFAVMKKENAFKIAHECVVCFWISKRISQISTFKSSMFVLNTVIIASPLLKHNNFDIYNNYCEFVVRRVVPYIEFYLPSAWCHYHRAIRLAGAAT